MRKIYNAWEEPEKTKIPSREEYISFVREKRQSQTDETGPEEEAEDEEGPVVPDVMEVLELNSGVIDLFRVKKDLPRGLQRTHATNFRNRFTNNTDPFSLFFQPALDYKKEPYSRYIYEDDKKNSKLLYLTSAQINRLKKRKPDHIKESIYQRLSNESTISKTARKKGIELYTLWSIYYPLLDNKLKQKLNAMDIFQKEGFANFLQKGIVFASSSLIELYCWFIQAQNTGRKGDELYLKFLEVVDENIEYSKLFRLIKKAIDQFVIYAEKICGIFDKMEPVTERWNIFNRQNPAYSCSGDTQSRQRLINAFNSPFFPNVLISTSVLQEGVNLQYNCRNVYHYGMAWTPGDNEQRIGRIDRMFGLVERRITKGKDDTSLNIYYPYLNNTFDKDQVADFIVKKYRRAAKAPFPIYRYGHILSTNRKFGIITA